MIFEKFPATIKIVEQSIDNLVTESNLDINSPGLIIEAFILPLFYGIVGTGHNFHPLKTKLSFLQVLEELQDEKADIDTQNCNCNKCNLLKNLLNNAEFLEELRRYNKFRKEERVEDEDT